MSTDHRIKKLARDFHARLRRALSAGQALEADALNRTAQYADQDAADNYLDQNAEMAQAYEREFGSWDVFNDEVEDRMDAAGDLARANGYSKPWADSPKDQTMATRKPAKKKAAKRKPAKRKPAKRKPAKKKKAAKRKPAKKKAAKRKPAKKKAAKRKPAKKKAAKRKPAKKKAAKRKPAKRKPAKKKRPVSAQKLRAGGLKRVTPAQRKAAAKRKAAPSALHRALHRHALSEAEQFKRINAAIRG